jgi:hypothetical protein
VPEDEARAALDGAGVVTLQRDARSVHEAWWTAARLHEHAIDAARPVVLVERPEARACFRVPDGARPLRAFRAGERADLARGLGALLGALFDRGLLLDDPVLDATLATPAGRVLVAAGARVSSGDLDDPRAALEVLGELSNSESHAAFARAQRSGARTRKDIEARTHG